jgi:hypothetical protein
MISLATLPDIQSLKYICDSVKNSTSWVHFCSEAQLLDVKPWLTDALLLEIIGQASTLPTTISAANQTLLDGGTYVYGTHTYFFQGLRNCIAYYAFARFTNRTAFNYTAAGIVVKESDFSTPITDKVMQRLETESRLTAEAIKCEIITYLNRNSTLYPLWEGSCNSSDCTSSRPFIVLGN